MAKLKVGDRVRIVGYFEGAPLLFIGQETVITEERDDLWTGNSHVHGYVVAIDDGGWGFTEDQLEPLTPPSAKTLTAEDILALPNLREFNIPLPAHINGMGLVS